MLNALHMMFVDELRAQALTKYALSSLGDNDEGEFRDRVGNLLDELADAYDELSDLTVEELQQRERRERMQALLAAGGEVV